MKIGKYVIAMAVLLLLFASACKTRSADTNDLLALDESIPIPISPNNTDAAEPAVAAAPDGSVYVAWVEHRPEGQADVFLRKLNSDKSLSAPVRVNPEIGKATAWRGDPPTLAVATDSSVYVAWTARAATKGHENNLYLSVSRDGGQTLSAHVKINDDQKPVAHGMHSLALDKQGRIYVAWLDERNLSPAAPIGKHRGEAQAMESNRDVFTAYSEDGGRTFSRNQMIAREACPCCKTAITTSPDGNVYVGWRQVLPGDLRHIAVASSGDNGRTYSTPVIVSDDKWVIAGCPVSGPALSARENGNLRVMWYTSGKAGTEGLYVSRSTDGGQTFSPRQIVSGGAIFGNPLLMPDIKLENDVAIWQVGDSGMMQAQITSTDSVRGTSRVDNTGKLPSVALANGRPVLAYISGANNQRSIWLVMPKQIDAAANQ